MSDNFGARMRRQRERQQIDLIAIASQTKIKLALLEALERDDVSHWPSGIFRRAYIRTYAEFIGLDPDVVLREFQQAHPDPEDVAAAIAAAAEAARRNAPPSARLRTMVDSAIGSLAKLRPAVVEQTPAVEAPHVPIEPAPMPPQPPAAVTPEPAGSRQAEPSDDKPLTPGLPAADATSRAAAEGDTPVNAGADAIGHERQAADESALEAIAHVCTELGRAAARDEIQRLLEESADVVNATGLVVWLWDQSTEELRPALTHGYSEKVLAHLPTVKRDADNATAAAFRSASPCEVAARPHTSGALVIPLLVSEGCTGVLAMEVPEGVQPTRSARAAAALLAAALAQLVRRSQQAYFSPAFTTSSIES